MPTRIFPSNFTLGIEKFISSNNGTEQMAVNGSSSHAEDIWDGTGASDTGSDWTRGGSGTESSNARHSGTNGLDTGTLSQNGTVWFDYGSDRDLESSFDSVSFWINVCSFPEGSKLYCSWATSSDGYSVGNSVDVSNYVSNMDIGEWNRVTVPLTDFSLDGYAGRFIIQSSQTSGQQFYLDDFDMLNYSNGLYKFRVIGVENETHYVSKVSLVISANEVGWASSAFGNISGGLELGIILRQTKISTNEIVWSFTIKNNMELFGIFEASECIKFSDDEVMFVFSITPKKSSIILTNDDSLELVVRDDLSTLTNMRGYVQYGIEEI